MKCLVPLIALLIVSAARSQTPVPDPADAPAAQAHDAVPSEADINTATSYLKDAWNDYSQCRRPSACNAYFESFGVAISFGDGSIAPFTHTQRRTATSRDCIKNAKAYLEQGNKSLAVQWAMASRIERIGVRDWLGNHPDAVVEALRHCCR